MHTISISVRRLIYTAAAFIILTIPAFAESVFHKDGSIADGKILRETDRLIIIKTAEGKNLEIARRDIIRIVYHKDFRQKKFIYALDGKVIESFIVDESADIYTYRTDINSAEEFKIEKTAVDFISKRKLEVIDKGKKVSEEKETGRLNREQALRQSAPRIRLGYGKYDTMSSGFWDSVTVLHADIFPYRFRNSNGNGFDLMISGKGILRLSPVTDPSRLKEIGNLPVFGDMTQLDTIDMKQLALGAGARYSAGFYAFNLLWQGYVSALAQYHMVIIDFDGYTTEVVELTYTVHRFGFKCHTGIEAALTDYLGLFIETGYGFVPGFENDDNVDGLSITAGVSYRSSFM